MNKSYLFISRARIPKGQALGLRRESLGSWDKHWTPKMQKCLIKYTSFKSITGRRGLGLPHDRTAQARHTLRCSITRFRAWVPWGASACTGSTQARDSRDETRGALLFPGKHSEVRSGSCSIPKLRFGSIVGS